MTKPGDYVIVVNAADGMENGDMIRVREVDGYGRFHLFGFDGPWNPERFEDAPSYAALAERVKVLEHDNKRLAWLHSPESNNVGGYEWGIYRVKWVNGVAAEVWQTMADFSDLDAAIAKAALARVNQPAAGNQSGE